MVHGRPVLEPGRPSHVPGPARPGSSRSDHRAKEVPPSSRRAQSRATGEPLVKNQSQPPPPPQDDEEPESEHDEDEPDEPESYELDEPKL